MAQPVNHITNSGGTLDLHRALTDEELDEQIAYWQSCKDRSESRDAWGYAKMLSTANMAKDERAHDPLRG